jgi:hypothetical protein
VELGAETRLLTNPHLNASRGIGSGDLDIHLLGTIHRESAGAPALAVRVDTFLPTGVTSHGTNVSAEAIATGSFDSFRVHATFGDLYVGSRGNCSAAMKSTESSASTSRPSERGARTRSRWPT